MALTLFAADLKAQSLFDVSVGKCLTDDEVAAADRALYEKPAMRFVETVIGGNPKAAYLQLADQFQAKLPADKFVRAVSQGVRPYGPFTDVHVAHSYRDSQVTTGGNQSMVACTAVAHGDASTPQGRVMIAVAPVLLQAHVIIEGKAKNNRWGFVLWLVSAEPEWRIAGFEIRPITILDRTAADLWTLARQEKERGDAFNAYILYVSAAQMADRGPDLQLGIQPEIVKEISALKAPADLSGKPPFEWKFPDATYRVVTIGPIGVGSTFDLRIVHQVAQTNDDQDLERQNQSLIKAFTTAHPEYSRVFDGLVVQALMPNGNGFGTVKQNDDHR
jgi:hypothetical protein